MAGSWTPLQKILLAAILALVGVIGGVVIARTDTAVLVDMIDGAEDAIGRVTSRPVDKPKFEGLYRAAKQMEGALAVGTTLLRYREFLQALATEVSIARDRASRKSEKEMTAAFVLALVAFKDAETIWSKKISNRFVDASSDGDLKRIVSTYALTNTATGGLDGDRAVQEIWITASSQLARGLRLYNGDRP